MANPLFFCLEEERIISILRKAAGNLDGPHTEAVLDFSSVRRIDSGAVRALEDFAQVTDERGVKIVLRGANVDVYKVLKLLRLTERFSFVN
jgi:anti-anti-sigma regulatory factor